MSVTSSPSRRRGSSSSGSREETLHVSLADGHASMWVWLCLFALVVSFLSGSSRHDAVQLIALRPLAALFLIPALYYLTLEQARKAYALLLILGLTAVWMAIQLMPLPPSVWQGLPYRDLVQELDLLTEAGEVWRPISWVPSRGWNALASLIVPAAALLLALAMRANWRVLLLLVAALGMMDALLGLAQLLSGRTSPLYFYAFTNRGSPVGIFANENHSAVFSAIALLVIVRVGTTLNAIKDPQWLRFAWPPAFLIVLLAILASNSRAGFLMAAVALFGSGLQFWLAATSRRKRAHQGKALQWLAQHPRVLLGLFTLLVIGLLTAFYQMEQAPGLEGLIARDTFDDLRASLWPVLSQMMSAHFWFGIGFGSFEEVYHIYEPTALLLPTYVNQAHNDWAQLVIEGGVPAAILLLATLGWMAFRLLSFLRDGAAALPSVIFWGAVIAIICSASLVDYPLRSPIFQIILAWLLLSLALERRNSEKA